MRRRKVIPLREDISSSSPLIAHSLTRAPLHITPLFIFKPSLSKTDVLDMVHPFAHHSLYSVGKLKSFEAASPTNNEC